METEKSTTEAGRKHLAHIAEDGREQGVYEHLQGTARLAAGTAGRTIA